jgi:hypothetical protein
MVEFDILVQCMPFIPQQNTFAKGSHKFVDQLHIEEASFNVSL